MRNSTKMPTKGRALFAWLRNLSSPSSNIPLLLNLSVATLTLKQGAMALRNEQFFLPGSKTLPHRFVALVLILLHFLVTVK